MDYEVILSDISFKQGRDYIKANFEEVHDVKPGYKLFDIYLIGLTPILVGVAGGHIIFTYMKPCRGTFVLKIKCEEEIERLRSV